MSNPTDPWEPFIPRRLRPAGITERRLVNLNREEHARLGVLAEQLGLTRPTMISTLLNLAEAFNRNKTLEDR